MGNYAFIDSQNVNLSIQEQGWKGVKYLAFMNQLREKMEYKKRAP